MTHLDHRKPPARAARRKQSNATPSRPAAGRKPNRSHSAIGAAVVAGAAMVAAFAFILTNGSSDPTTDDSIRTGSLPQASAPAVQPPGSDPTQAASGKADRKPPAGKTAPGKSSTTNRPTKSVAPPNTGSQSPTFRRGQWIAAVDSYPTDAGMPADQLARTLAAKLIAAGVPAKALLANGQYPGLANSNFEPITNTWIVYVGPFPSADAANALCVSAKVQQAYGTLPACPTHEPAKAQN